MKYFQKFKSVEALKSTSINKSTSTTKKKHVYDEVQFQIDQEIDDIKDNENLVFFLN
jgi:hypothetical protein